MPKEEVNSSFVHTGESASLYNYTLSPGWTDAEVKVLRLALIKFGIGKWSEIMNSGALPGKNPAQMNLQTQRLLGQQSTAEFMGLHIDPDKVREVNAAKQGPEYRRKNNCLVNTGNKLTREEIQTKKAYNKKHYGVSEDMWKNIELPIPGKGTNPTAAVGDANTGSTKPTRVIFSDIDTDSEAPCTSDSDTEPETEEKKLPEVTATDFKLLEGELSSLFERLRSACADRKAIQSQLSQCRSKIQSEKSVKTSANQNSDEEITQPKVRTLLTASNQNGKQNTKNGAKTTKNTKGASKKKTEKKKGGVSVDWDAMVSDREGSDEVPKSKTPKKEATKKQSNKGEEEVENADCVCGAGYAEGDTMLDCDGCHKWYHNECVGVPLEVEDGFEWKCPSCV
eukprot:comp7598_c1_seq1/m.3248 comp7598_c1_seq1/g.3248  ORF comp7598_c1_seq1/g.3248 comp7598_c1_seq1/m.3248 type:complete len:395 (-) comp7598_c1_seq1:54-1238(-)